MIKIKITEEYHNTKELATELEHIAMLITQGWRSTDRWALTGEEEKEVLIPAEFVEEELPDDNEVG